MLQSQNVARLLAQLLAPMPEVSASAPISISLVSVETELPLLSVSTESPSAHASSHSSRNSFTSHHSSGSFGSSGSTGSSERISRQLGNLVTKTYSKNLQADPSYLHDLQKRVRNAEENSSESGSVAPNLNPNDNLSIIAILCVRRFKLRRIRKGPHYEQPWMVLQSRDYVSYLYEVNEQYMVLLCCDANYPKGFAVKRLRSLCQYLEYHM